MSTADGINNLFKAQQNITDGARQVWRQRKIVWEMERNGHDATHARQLLKKFEHELALRVEFRERLKKEKW